MKALHLPGTLVPLGSRCRPRIWTFELLDAASGARRMMTVAVEASLSRRCEHRLSLPLIRSRESNCCWILLHCLLLTRCYHFSLRMGIGSTYLVLSYVSPVGEHARLQVHTCYSPRHRAARRARCVLYDQHNRPQESSRPRSLWDMGEIAHTRRTRNIRNIRSASGKVR